MKKKYIYKVIQVNVMHTICDGHRTVSAGGRPNIHPRCQKY